MVDAPWHDLKLIHNLLRYEAVNLSVAKSALQAFKQHTWYLTEEMVPLALFSILVPAAERRAIADKLLLERPSTAPETSEAIRNWFWKTSLSKRSNRVNVTC